MAQRTKNNYLLGIVLLALALVNASCSSDPKPAPPAVTSASPETVTKGAADEAGSVIVTIENYAFHPAQVTVAPGTKIIWRNKDDVGHSATSDTQAFDSGIFGKDKEFARVFSEAGTFPYHCLPHPQMKATVIVK